MTPTAPSEASTASTKPTPSSVSPRPRKRATIRASRVCARSYLDESSVTATPMFLRCAVCSASSPISLPPPASRSFSFRATPESSRSSSIFCSNPFRSTLMPRSSAMSSVRSTGNPMEVYRKCASAPEKTCGLPAAAISANRMRPLSSVRENDSSSSLIISVTNSCRFTISGNASPIIRTTTGTSFAKNPRSAPRFCRPYRTARRRIRRSTYPRPSLEGTAPSVIANVSVRTWSATTRYAMSTAPASSAPSRPPYPRAHPVIR
mmetsp:Transcript_36906/g.72616  ORF Transcript_36906/g.72616 Transcript_36906/m.72616 type:complete len:263 (+) Transcript_36906:1460-2248(+)